MMTGKASILVVEDERDIRELITFNLMREGYAVTAVDNAEKALDHIGKTQPDLVLLDMMLPGMDGFEALKRIRSDKATSKLPVILVTARTEDSDIVAGLELGADDYICKPFSPRVLVARVRTRLRETALVAAGNSGSDVSNLQAALDPEYLELTSNGIHLDAECHEVFVGGQVADLTATEFSLLEFFMSNPGHVFSRQRLINAVRGPGYPVTDRAVDVQIVGLRKKLGASGDFIETVRGVGYRYREGAQI